MLSSSFCPPGRPPILLGEDRHARIAEPVGNPATLGLIPIPGGHCLPVVGDLSGAVTASSQNEKLGSWLGATPSSLDPVTLSSVSVVAVLVCDAEARSPTGQGQQRQRACWGRSTGYALMDHQPPRYVLSDASGLPAPPQTGTLRRTTRGRALQSLGLRWITGEKRGGRGGVSPYVPPPPPSPGARPEIPI